MVANKELWQPEWDTTQLVSDGLEEPGTGVPAEPRNTDDRNLLIQVSPSLQKLNIVNSFILCQYNCITTAFFDCYSVPSAIPWQVDLQYY